MILYSFNGHAINDKTNYEAIIPSDSPLMASTKATYVQRSAMWPVYSAKVLSETRFSILVAVRGGTGSLDQLKTWFDTMTLDPVKLVGSEDSKYWAMMVVPESITAIGSSAVKVVLSTSDMAWVDDGVGSSSSWNITASGQTKVISVSSERYVEPTFDISAVSGKGYIYLRHVKLFNRVGRTFVNFPIDVTNGGWNTAALVTAGKMLSSGNDLRVFVDGTEVDRWLSGMNTASTKVWINLDLKPSIKVALKTAIASSGSISAIYVLDTPTTTKTNNKAKLSRLPKHGMLTIDSEVFAYSSINLTKLCFTGITRALNGSSMAAHSANASIYWVEHDVKIMYGDVNAQAPETDDTQMPIINLSTSTNTSWVYASFGEFNAQRAGAWEDNVERSAGKASLIRTGNAGADISPYEAMGMEINTYYAGSVLKSGSGKLTWSIHVPCGVTTVSSNGYKYRGGTTVPATAALKYLVNNVWTSLWNESSPASASTWTAWTRSSVATANLTDVMFVFEGTINANGVRANFEVRDVTLSLTSANVPSVTMGSEVLHEWVDIMIENTTNDDWVQVVYPFTSDTLTVNCEDRTAFSGLVNRFGALRLNNSAYWLRLMPGSNTLKATGYIGNINIAIGWKDKKL